MATVYLETSFVSACVTDRTDVESLGRKRASLRWWKHESGRHELFLSAEVLAELDRPEHRLRSESAKFIAGIPQLAVTDEVLGFAAILVREKVMPGPVAGDAIHVAVCAVHRIDYLLTWNVRHLANMRKRAHLQVVCTRSGLLAPDLVTPDLLRTVRDAQEEAED